MSNGYSHFDLIQYLRYPPFQPRLVETLDYALDNISRMNTASAAPSFATLQRDGIGSCSDLPAIERTPNEFANGIAAGFDAIGVQTAEHSP